MHALSFIRIVYKVRESYKKFVGSKENLETDTFSLPDKPESETYR